VVCRIGIASAGDAAKAGLEIAFTHLHNDMVFSAQSIGVFRRPRGIRHLSCEHAVRHCRR
jgi:hypothetical protein